jgi:S-(hydroxymethyl)glutathione dehydrogenase/alcohol dehydrogenase
VVPGELIEASLQLTRKGGTCVLTGLGRMGDTRVSMDMSMLTLMNKEVKGCLFGSGNPRVEIPNLLSLYRSGQLKLDELVTRTYTLDEVNEGYRDMREGRNVRGVILFD